MRFGWHGIRAIRAYLNEQERQDIWQEYTAAVLHSIGQIAAGLGGAEYPMPSYIEMMHPEYGAKRDDRSGEDIVRDMIHRLRGEGSDGSESV